MKNAQAALAGAERQLAALKAQRANAVASLVPMIAQREQARLDLSYTIVTAAQSGRVVNLTAAWGNTRRRAPT